METTQITNFRRKVLRDIARYTWDDCLTEKIYDILYKTVREDTPRVRCCVHKERAVLKNRIQMALWQPIGLNIINAAQATLDGVFDKTLNVMDVLPQACDACPIDRYYVTDVCRHCVQHKCIDHCPKKAISIQAGRAYIDRDECIDCGTCLKVCPFNAITEIVRPCVKACGLGAISPGEDGRTVIDHEKCISCGTCRSACPFGALEERSMIVHVLMALKAKKKVYALMAPSYAGQFGPKAAPGQILAALKKLGFAGLVEVSLGADLTALNEAEEFLDKVPDKQSFMTSSCCPAFVQLVEKHFPEYKDNVSETVSPMVATGRWMKEREPEAVTCFVGPCIAKKGEAIANGDCIDFVLTYEELACIFEGLDIKVEELEPEEIQLQGSADGMRFPLDRGVSQAVKSILQRKHIPEPTMEYADGSTNIKEKLTELKTGKLSPEPAYFEGMACVNGCIDGPGTMSLPGFTKVMVSKLADTSAAKTAQEDAAAVTAAKRLALERRKAE